MTETALSGRARLPTFRHVPDDAAAVAREVLRIAGPDLESVCAALGVRPRKMHFDAKSADTPALMCPRESGGFSAVVAASVIEEDMAAARFYVAHEAGHALFYDRTKVPHTRAAAWDPSTGSPLARAEEHFCDDFAAELLVREYAPVDRLWSQPT